MVGMGDVTESPPPYSSVVQDTSNTRQGSQSTQSANRGSVYYQPQDAARQPGLVQHPPCPDYQPPGQFNRPLSHGPEPLGKVYHPQDSAFHPQAPPPPYSGPTQWQGGAQPGGNIATGGQPSDDTDNYASKCAVGLGTANILLGITSLATLILLMANGHPTLGWFLLPVLYVTALFVTTGAIGINGGQQKTSCLLTATFIFSILSASTALNILIVAIFMGTHLELPLPMLLQLVLALAMLTVASFSASLTRKVVCGRRQPKINDYASNLAIGLGVAQIVIGMIDMGLVLLLFRDFIEHSDYWDGWVNFFVFYGFISVGSFVHFIISGSLAIAGGVKKTRSLLIATLVFSIISALSAVSLFRHARREVVPGLGLGLGVLMLFVATISAVLPCKARVCNTEPQPEPSIPMYYQS